MSGPSCSLLRPAGPVGSVGRPECSKGAVRLEGVVCHLVVGVSHPRLRWRYNSARTLTMTESGRIQSKMDGEKPEPGPEVERQSERVNNESSELEGWKRKKELQLQSC